MHLVVDARQSDAVVRVLRDDLGLDCPPPAASPALRLARIALPDLAGYRAAVYPRLVNELIARHGAPSGISDVHVLLMDLRTRFSRDHGHVPELDDDGDAVLGLPQHKFEPVDPVPVDAVPERVAQPGDGAGIHVGVVDTRFHDLPEFAGTVTGDRHDGPVTDIADAHGTFVCSVLKQVAPAARITVAGALGGMEARSTGWDLAVRMTEVFAAERPQVVNMSLGTDNDVPAAPLTIRRVLDWLGPDVLVVAAAGNRQRWPDPPAEIWPAAATEVVAVGARGAGFSMVRPWVDLLAPGVDVVGSWVPGLELRGRTAQHASWSGTSFAAPRVSGAVAALMSRNPGMTAREAVGQVPSDPRWQITTCGG